MKKILLFSLLAILALGSVQAQKKTKRLSPAAAKGQKEIPAAVELKSEPILLPDAIEGLELPLFDALKLRCTYRDFTEEELSLELISSLLWSAYGFNRPEEGKRVAPSAVNVQEFDIYLFTREGIYIYDAAKNTIQMVVQGDHRAEITEQISRLTMDDLRAFHNKYIKNRPLIVVISGNAKKFDPKAVANLLGPNVKPIQVDFDQMFRF